MKLTLGMSNLKFSLDEQHPNKMIIEGCITKIGVPSTAAPCGSDGRQIVFTTESVNSNYNSFKLMPINCTFPDDWDWSWSPGTEVFTGHGDINIGVIEDVWPNGEDLMAKIVIWKMLFPSIGFMITNGKDSLGFSIECQADDTHNGTDDGFMYIDKFTGTGAAILWKNTAAFNTTYIKELVASLQNTNKKKDDVLMELTKEQLEEMLKGLFAEVNEKFETIKSSVEERVSAVETKVESVVSEVKAEVDKANGSVEALAEGFAETKETIKAMNEKQIQASVQTPAPTVTQTVVANADVTVPVDNKQKIAEINASNMTMVEKIKAINALK